MTVLFEWCGRNELNKSVSIGFLCQTLQGKQQNAVHTLGTVMFAMGQKQLETRVIIKISTHATQIFLTDFHGDEDRQKMDFSFFASFRPYVGQPDNHIG